jgi:hypothetical protein
MQHRPSEDLRSRAVHNGPRSNRDRPGKVWRRVTITLLLMQTLAGCSKREEEPVDDAPHGLPRAMPTAPASFSSALAALIAAGAAPHLEPDGFVAVEIVAGLGTQNVRDARQRCCRGCQHLVKTLRSRSSQPHSFTCRRYAHCSRPQHCYVGEITQTAIACERAWVHTQDVACK